jgi:hypothetical protein
MKRVEKALQPLTLAELQLLMLGIWVIGEENRVDPRVMAEYGWLSKSLSGLANERAAIRRKGK